MSVSLPKNSKQAPIEVYTKDYCPYCTAATNLLTQRGMAFEKTDISGNQELTAQMLKRAAPRVTVPQIFIAGQAIGGFTDLKKLDDDAQLESLVFPKGRE